MLHRHLWPCRQGDRETVCCCINSAVLLNCLMNCKSHNLTGKSQIRNHSSLTVEQLGLHLVDYYWLQALFSLLLTLTIWQDYPRISVSSAEHIEWNSRKLFRFAWAWKVSQEGQFAVARPLSVVSGISLSKIVVCNWMKRLQDADEKPEWRTDQREMDPFPK